MKNIYTVAEVVKMTGEDRKLKNILKYARGGEIVHEL